MESRLTQTYGARAHTCCGEELRPFWAEDGRLISICRHCGEEKSDRGMVRFGGAPWIGVDLDGTLAADDPQSGPDEIGEPIAPMMERVRNWIRQGRTVKIFTARASVPRQVAAVKEWLKKYGLPDLEVTNVKDFGMIELWDDRCVRVAANSGKPENDLHEAPLRRDSIRLKVRVQRRGLASSLARLRMFLTMY